MDKSIEELEHDRALLQAQLREMNDRREQLEQLEEKIAKKKTKKLLLPSKPGWYESEDGQIYRLTEDGDWDDGWGNSYFDPAYSIEGLDSDIKLYRLVREEK